MTRSFAILVLVLSLSSIALRSQAGRSVLVLDGGTLIDGTGAPAVPEAVVVVEGNRIAAAGPASRVSVPAGARVVSTKGQFVIPGLIDGHVHYWDWFGELLLAYGVTSVVDLGNFSDYMVALTESIEKGHDVGPRIFASGEFIVRSGGAAGDGEGAEEVRILQAQTFVSSEQEAREKVRELVGRRMKIIKVFQNLTAAQLSAIVDEAHRLGLPVAGHSRDAIRSIGAGQDHLAHESSIISSAIRGPAGRQSRGERGVACSASLMDAAGMEELASLMAARGVYYNPTFVTRYKLFSRRGADHERADYDLFARSTLQYIPLEVRASILASYRRLRNERAATNPPSAGFTWADAMTRADLDAHRACYERSLEFVKRFVAKGGLLNAGTDTPSTSIPGKGLHQELEILAEAGLTPMQVLQAATTNTAKFLRMDKMLGTLEPGKLADLVVLDADPLADIGNTQKIALVVKDGRILDRAFHREYDPIIKRPMGLTIPVLPELYRPSSFFLQGLITSVQPGMATEGSGDLAIEVVGMGFSDASVVRLMNYRLKTEFLNPGRLKAMVPSRLLRAPGTFPVTVESPASGGGSSNPYGFIVRFK
jgi:imidazolonepropionase-like amidohydrolase